MWAILTIPTQLSLLARTPHSTCKWSGTIYAVRVLCKTRKVHCALSFLTAKSPNVQKTDFYELCKCMNCARCACHCRIDGPSGRNKVYKASVRSKGNPGSVRIMTIGRITRNRILDASWCYPVWAILCWLWPNSEIQFNPTHACFYVVRYICRFCNISIQFKARHWKFKSEKSQSKEICTWMAANPSVLYDFPAATPLIAQSN